MLMQVRKGKHGEKCKFCGKGKKVFLMDYHVRNSNIACIPCMVELGDEYAILLSKWRLDFFYKVMDLYEDVLSAYRLKGVHPPNQFGAVIQDFSQDYVPISTKGRTERITFTITKDNETLHVFYEKDMNKSKSFSVNSTLDVMKEYYNRQIFIDTNSLKVTNN